MNYVCLYVISLTLSLCVLILKIKTIMEEAQNFSYISQMAHNLQLLDGTMHLDSVQNLSTGLQTILSEFNPAPNQAQINNYNNTMGLGLVHPSLVGPTLSVIHLDSQENDVLLVHALMACAKAIQEKKFQLVNNLLKQIEESVKFQVSPMCKIAIYFKEALARRACVLNLLFPPNPEACHANFYEAIPYLKFTHFTTNKAILEAIEGKTHVHIIDFNLNQEMQWPTLIHAMSQRPSGPPMFRLTAIGSPDLSDRVRLQEVGHKLAQMAEAVGVGFKFKGIMAKSLADLNASLLKSKESECVVVNSVFEFHKLLAQLGSLEKVLNMVRLVKSKIMTVAEHEANHNGPDFLNRFSESLQYYLTLFDSLEGSINGSVEDKALTEAYFGREILNLVTCEGVKRVVRHETQSQWRTQFSFAGFFSFRFRYNEFNQVSMLVAMFEGSKGFSVKANNGSLMLGWKDRPLVTTSAWQPVY